MSGDPFRLAGEVRLRPGREASVLRGHPWVYRGSLAAPLPPSLAPVVVRSANGERLGVALPGASGGSLSLRLVAWGEEVWDAAALRGRLAAAVELRHRLALDADAYRLVHAEGDGLPGLVVDRYREHAVIELFEAAWEPYLEVIARFLAGPAGCRTVLLRRPGAGRGEVEVLRGAVPNRSVIVREGALRLAADLARGQKTGLFLDQRETRRRVGELAAGLSVLNLFSYSGGIAAAARRGGAVAAVNVDASADALALARETYLANGLPVDEGEFVQGDAFQLTRELLATPRRFDLVVVDPPAFVRRKAELARGLSGYRDINLQALRLLRPGGLLVTCSCSALVSEEQFAGAVLAAALDAGRRVTVLERRGAGPDHPVLLACPETRHLKVLLCRA